MKAFRNQIDYFLNGNEPVLVHNITVNTTTRTTLLQILNTEQTRTETVGNLGLGFH
jgi:hypothetical protein